MLAMLLGNTLLPYWESVAGWQVTNRVINFDKHTFWLGKVLSEETRRRCCSAAAAAE